MTNSGSAHVGGGAGSGKVSVQDVTLSKFVDSSSPMLMLACCNGTHYPGAVLTVRKAGGPAAVEYVKVKMEQVLVASIGTGGSYSNDRLTENVMLNFSKVSVDYTPQDAKGAPGTTIPFAWDIAANCKD